MTKPKLIVFDLDGTLVDSDSAQDWMYFLRKNSWPYSKEATEICSEIMQDYSSGRMNMKDYMQAWVLPIKGKRITEITALATEFAEHYIKPRIYTEGMSKVREHQKAGDILLVISASPTIIVEPIAALFGIQHVIGIDIEVSDSKITQNVIEPFSFGNGKVALLKRWQKQHGLEDLPLDCIYSDSINDVPLLDYALNSHVINGNEQMRSIAKENGWCTHEWSV